MVTGHARPINGQVHRLTREWHETWEGIRATTDLYGAPLRERLGSLYGIADEIAHHASHTDLEKTEIRAVVEVQERILKEVLYSVHMKRADLG